MRKYNAVENTLSVITNPNYSVTIEKFKGGRLKSSLLYLTKYINDVENFKTSRYRDLLCLYTNQYNTIATHYLDDVPYLSSKNIAIFHNSGMSYAELAKCSKQHKYWFIVGGQLNLTMLEQLDLKVDKLYVQDNNLLVSKRAIEVWLYAKCDLIRKLKVKQLYVELKPDVIINGSLIDLRNPTNAEIIFVIDCKPNEQITKKLGILEFKCEDEKWVPGFIIPKDLQLPECNQYFYQDKSFIHFTTVQYIGDITSYSIIYYNNNKVTERIANDIDILNIMDLNKRSG